MFSISIVSALVLASCQQALAQSCSGFNVTTNYSDLTYTSISDRSFIISEGVSCPATRNCTLIAGGYVTDGSTLNTSDQASASSIFKTISGVVNRTSGYVAFTPYTICATGRLSGCQGNDLEGQIVTACALEGVKYGGLNGVASLVITDRKGASSLTCNPSNTTQAMNGNYSGSAGCTGTQDSTGTGSTLHGVSLALLASSILVAFVGF
jgi:hypothetical protein